MNHSFRPSAEQTLAGGRICFCTAVYVDEIAVVFGCSCKHADSTSSQPNARGGRQSGSHVLVAYYSATGHTADVAKAIADAANGDLFELTPKREYSSGDLNWNDEFSRVNGEHNDESLRDVPLNVTSPDGWDKYDTVFIGYPIWWGGAVWPVNHFVTDNDFTGEKVIPFATSASSPLGSSGSDLADMAGAGDWQDGQRFSSSVSADEVTSWVEGLGL